MVRVSLVTSLIKNTNMVERPSPSQITPALLITSEADISCLVLFFISNRVKIVFITAICHRGNDYRAWNVT